MFPLPSKVGLISRKQFFGLDLVEDKTERTLWTQKPSVWSDLFSSVQELAKKGQVEAISTMFNDVFACPVHAVPKGPRETKTFRSGKGQNIQHWIMFIPMPANVDSTEYVTEFISKFQALCKKTHIRSAYKVGVNEITQHPELLTSVSEDGNYWTTIDNASQRDIILKSHTCLSEVLCDFTIKLVGSLMFDVNKDLSSWFAAVTTYAFGP